MAFLSFLIVVALVVCHNPKQLPEEKSEELPVFNLEAVAEETVPSAFMWNDITEKATFIPLSSDEKTLLSGSLGITFMDNEYIVIVDYKTGSFYRYGVDGKVQRSFKYEGNGPGEYVYISYLYVDPGYAFMDIYDSGNRKRIRKSAGRKRTGRYCRPRLCDGALYGFLWNARDGVSILYS